MNAAQKIVYEFQMKRFEAFKAQDSETGDFDVVFEIAGKKLYAHKFILRPISPTFNSMLSDRWSKHGEPVKIEGYAFEDFKDFLTFIYSGKCEFTDANIFAMVDIAEFYGIKAIKEECETYLPEMLNLENVYHMIELACKYSLDQFKTSIIAFVSKNLAIFCKSPKFAYLHKTFVHEIVTANQETPNQEEMFEAAYKWAEYRGIEKQKLNESLDLEKTIKDELSEILPLLKYEKMGDLFINKFIVEKSFLFSDDQINDILWARNKWRVKVVDKNGKLLKGVLQCDDIETVANVIESVKDQSGKGIRNDYCFWNTKQPKPSMRSKLIYNNKIEWYLVYDRFGDLAVKKRILLNDNDYLLAEMSAENGFVMSKGCKIENCL